MSNWYDFLDTADQFFISYSISPSLIPVKLFEIGHTVELYLKATSTKLTGDIDRAIKFGHNIKAIWDECKKLDGSFLPNYEIRDTIFNSDFIKNNGGHYHQMTSLIILKIENCMLSQNIFLTSSI